MTITQSPLNWTVANEPPRQSGLEHAAGLVLILQFTHTDDQV